MASSPLPLAPEDERLIDRLAAKVVDLRLEVPAILALESGKPLSVLASQAMVFFQPMAEMLFPGESYLRFARLIERREAVEALATRIEERAHAARARRKAGSAPGAAPGGPGRRG